MRQRDPTERRHLAELHDGEPDRYLRHKLETGELELCPDVAHAEQRALTAWSAAQAERLERRTYALRQSVAVPARAAHRSA